LQTLLETETRRTQADGKGSKYDHCFIPWGGVNSFCLMLPWNDSHKRAFEPCQSTIGIGIGIASLPRSEP
jgi:hypothetical protein